MALAILGVVVTPLNEVGKCLFGALKRQINYLTSYHANIEDLRSGVKRLIDQKTDVRRRVEAAKSNLDVPTEEVMRWLEVTERIVEDDMRTFEEEMNANKVCLKGLCPDIISRLKLSKKAAKKLEAINSLLEQQGNFTEASIAHPRRPVSVEPIPIDGVENFPSRDSVMKDVMEALGNDSIKSIAVHGMGGIGKTTLVDKLNNELHGSQLFKKVIKVVVSKEPVLNKIQDDIADRLGLNLKGVSSAVVRASMLFERLKAEGPVLIILDDLWEKLDVVAIGIPGGSQHIGCKIMLTTRNLNICNQMNIQKIIKLDRLSEDESWGLFETKAGDVVRFSNLKLIAQEIVRRCMGSPLAIATLGSTLRAVEEECVWRDALTVLKNPNRSGLEDIMPEVVESIGFSYKYLHSRDIKLCFLFCCLFPEDYNIDLLQLRDYGVGEEFLSVNETLEEASNKLLSLVKKLKDCGLLLEGDDKNCQVKMHDVVRDVAIAISSDDENGFLVKVGRQLRNSQEREKSKGYKRMSFMKNENLVLPDPPLECPQLRSLLIKGNASVSAEESCFEGMKSLMVLDVSMEYSRRAPDQKFSTLPSLRCLSNLRTLYLVGCDLSNKVSLLGGLRNLEILRLCGSEIGRLPKEIGNLSNLMCLDLTEAKLSFVAPNVISRLSNLEELYMLNMINGYCDWDQVGRGDEPNASLAEVASLKHLSILRIHIQAETPHDMQFHWWNNLKEFHVRMHHHSWINFPISSVDRPSLSYDSRGDGPNASLAEVASLKLSTSTTLDISGVNLDHWVNKLLSIPKVRYLGLWKCVGITNVADAVAMGGGIKRVEMWNCDSLEYLSSYSSAVALESVESIIIFYCNGMKKLIVSNSEKGEGEATSSYSYSSKFTISPPPTTFPNLQYLEIAECGNLKSLFSFTMARDLQQLKELKVSVCQNLEEIVAKEEEEEEVEHQYFLPRLHELKLFGCENLTSIIQGNLPISCPLKTIIVKYCPNLKKLPLQPQITSSLETLEGSTEWFEGLEWEDESLRSLLQQKFKPQIEDGDGEGDDDDDGE